MFLSPYELLLEKVQRKEIDPEDIDIENLVKEFKAQADFLESSDCLRLAGSFLKAVVSLLKFKVLKFFPEEGKEKERKPKVKLSEILEVLKEEQDLEWLYEYEVKVGRPKGRKDTKDRQKPEPELVPLHREFKIENYRKVLQDLNVEDFETLKLFLSQIKDRIERLRFFIAWL